YRAAQALGYLKDPRAVEPLLVALKDANNDYGDLSEYVNEALHRIFAREQETDNDVSQSYFEMVELLINALREEDSKLGAWARAALDNLKNCLTIEFLIASLQDENAMVREYAAKLNNQSDAPALEALIYALKDKEPTVRRLAPERLGRLGDS